VPAFDSGRVAAEQPGALFHVTLGEILGFSKFSEFLTNLHRRECTPAAPAPPVETLDDVNVPKRIFLTMLASQT